MYCCFLLGINEHLSQQQQDQQDRVKIMCFHHMNIMTGILRNLRHQW